MSDIKLPSTDDAVAHMLPSDLKEFEEGDYMLANAFSVAVGSTSGELSQPLFTLDQMREYIKSNLKYMRTKQEEIGVKPQDPRMDTSIERCARYHNQSTIQAIEALLNMLKSASSVLHVCAETIGDDSVEGHEAKSMAKTIDAAMESKK